MNEEELVSLRPAFRGHAVLSTDLPLLNSKTAWGTVPLVKSAHSNDQINLFSRPFSTSVVNKSNLFAISRQTLLLLLLQKSQNYKKT